MDYMYFKNTICLHTTFVFILYCTTFQRIRASVGLLGVSEVTVKPLLTSYKCVPLVSFSMLHNCYPMPHSFRRFLLFRTSLVSGNTGDVESFPSKPSPVVH